MIENQAYFQEPLSRAIAAMVAMQGKYTRTNTRKLAAFKGVNGGSCVIGEGIVSLSDSLPSS